ncbi:MAG: hypothetical protein SXG53_26495 [Pseudomonadota bacterium]|nr:hypothetical protein [Pseudomonadota bacterium]
MSGGVLQAGQRLIIPNGVVGIHNNAGTIKPYDPSRALGDINPPHVSPPKATGGNGCGVFGQVLVAAVSLAVTLIAPFGPNAVIANALAGNVAGQAVGVGTGVQDGFSFKSLALASVGAGVTLGLGELASAPGALGQVGKFLAGSGLPNQIVGGAVSSAISQGIGVATGLQDKFSWAGVAAAGVSSGVGTFVADRTQSLGQFGSNLVSNGAALIANAATRSAIEGSSFGDNILAGLPDVVGQALGRSLANAVKRSGAPENLIPDAFFEARIQQPGTQVSADPSRSRAVAVGLSVAEALAFGDSPLGAMASEGATQDPGYGQLRRTLTPGTGEVTIATGPTGSETILFTDEMQAPISAYVAGAQEGRYVLTKGGLEQAIIDGTLVGGYDASLAPQTDLGKLMAWVAAGNEVPRATITILTQTTETEQVMGSIAMHPAGTALYHVFPSPIDPKNALAILEKNNPTSAKLGTYAPLALGVTSITSKGLRTVATESTQVISSGANVAAERAALGIEARFQANSLRLADEGHDIFTQGVANGEIVLNPRLSMEIQRGSFVDSFVRRGNHTLRNELGLDASTVRINQRLYEPSGKFSVPDIHFPVSGNSIDYSYQFKNATTPQILRIQQAAPNGVITIVPPSAVRSVYTIRP